MKTFKNFFSIFKSVGKTKKRRTRRYRGNKRRSKRFYKMRGG